MWYVVQVNTGTEERIQTQCRKNIPYTVLERCFIPYYEEKKQIRGEWSIQTRILFPGYVFMVTDHIEELFEQLKHIIGLTRILGSGQEIVPLRDEETTFLQSFGGEQQIVGMSEGIIKGSRVIVHSGPLIGREGLICKIDRHKRRAWLEMELFGRRQKVQVGLEIIEKTASD